VLNMNEILLSVKGLRIQFKNEDGPAEVVSGVDLKVHKGETIGIVGESGCGKSVTSLAIMGLIPSPPGKVVDGEVWFNGKNLLLENSSSLRKIRGNDISMIFQEPMSSLDPAFSIGSQIDEAIRFHKKTTQSEIKKRSIELLRIVGIPNPEQRYKEYPHQLSGGMRQRVMIAIALACNPKLIIADEPTTALDVTVQAQILNLMKEIREKINTSIMLITHDMGVVAEMCDRVVVMYAGEVVEEASTEDLFDQTAHPYTEGLLKSIPNIYGPKSRLHSIDGSVPNPTNMPIGCRFHPRCPYATDKCRQIEPVLVEIERGHLVKCWHSDKISKRNGGGEKVV
jgi:oligopeptide/dipeptide ABC transporter ATP-binding protein